MTFDEYVNKFGNNKISTKHILFVVEKSQTENDYKKRIYYYKLSSYMHRVKISKEDKTLIEVIEDFKNKMYENKNKRNF